MEILTGNPCTDYKYYRQYTVTVLKQIEQLDCTEIMRTERILAEQQFDEKVQIIDIFQLEYLQKRKESRVNSESQESKIIELDDADIEKFWNEPSENTPEERVRIAKRAEKIRNKNSGYEEKKPIQKIRLHGKDGRPLNINQARLQFKLLDDDENGCKILDLAVYKYMDTSHLSVDLQPTYVTIQIKGQIFQLVLEEEVITDKSTCQRSETTGHLVVRMPKLNWIPKPKTVILPSTPEEPSQVIKKLPFLEIQPASDKMDYTRICDRDEEFVDDPNVPPLE